MPPHSAIAESYAAVLDDPGAAVSARADRAQDALTDDDLPRRFATITDGRAGQGRDHPVAVVLNNQPGLGLGGGPLSGPNPGFRGNQNSQNSQGGRGGQGGRAGGGPGGRGGSGVGAGRMPVGGTGLGNPNAAKGFGPGGSSGVLPPGESVAGRGGAASGGAAGRGGAGAGAMGGMGAGGARGQGEEDIERTTPSYLLEPDPDEVFGNPEMVAPPVIGG